MVILGNAVLYPQVVNWPINGFNLRTQSSLPSGSNKEQGVGVFTVYSLIKKQLDLLIWILAQ
jgi:hypothetical protein